jgi:8-oxo-dGTP pyrophosphatase MutT (NUDIX family)
VKAEESAKRASVAMIVGPKNEELHLLFIKRAEHPEDPWSGHMALPGGRHDATDDGDLQTALRETREEVGIDLEHEAELLGALDHVRASAKGRNIDMTIAPFVFYVKTLSPVVISSEVVSAHWAPIRPLFDGSANTQLSVTHPEGIVTLPAWNVDGNHVWGLTYRMVQSLFSLLSSEGPQDLPCP